MKIIVNRNFFVVLLLDLILLFCSIYLAHLIRFDFTLPAEQWNSLVTVLPFLLCMKLFCFYFFDLYKGIWRYTSLNDLVNIVKASTAATVGIIVLILYVNRFENISRSVYIIDWCLTVIFMIGTRVLIRLGFSKFTEDIGFKEIKDAFLQTMKLGRRQGNRVLIIGAGDCGEMVCREFRENASIKSYVVGFLDDDKSKLGRKIHGIPVMGKIEDIGRVVESAGIEDVIIAIPSIGPDRMRYIISLCEQADVNFKTVPDMGEIIDGRIKMSSIRDVEYRDLLGRKPVKLDKHKIGAYLGGKVVLVTGAAGSIGSGLCKQICRYAPEKIILFERAESPLYDLDLELKKLFRSVEIIPVLGDVQNKEELLKIFDAFHPQIVFHAAAYKHVPMMEKYPWKAAENNIFATRNIVDTADRFKCEKFVFVSTDKAVNPFNVMGASKRISEMIVQSHSTMKHSKTRFITVRFGNVIGSVGSVIPLFKKQIQEGGPVTVTHPEMIRFFMLIPEACQLILQAGSMGKGGEIFILKMGAPVKIDTMARDLIRFSGFEPDVDIKIEYTGLRPGEKLYEELMTDQENVVPTAHEKIMILESSQVDMKVLDEKLDALRTLSEKRNSEEIRKVFKQIVPEYNLNPEQHPL
ncbi:MAG: polysaccharide biosynthesis protein [Proteobacteria bacterium]|nr:polysaccharide biosynthesis protein [Pseudomonadota bacterium]MBU1541334.1 polysaccharide biosynthesis protein [Pseudomonadota bacterium]